MAGAATAVYSAAVIDHFERPRNVGRFAEEGAIEAEAGSVGQGTRFHLSALTDGSALTQVRFEAYGCPHCIAAASWLTEALVGAHCDDLLRWNWREVGQVLEVPAEKRGHLLILEDAVRRLAEVWQGRG